MIELEVVLLSSRLRIMLEGQFPALAFFPTTCAMASADYVASKSRSFSDAQRLLRVIGDEKRGVGARIEIAAMACAVISEIPGCIAGEVRSAAAVNRQ